ncbi:hypothetical protein AV521_01350 [Streptomyces sp. IMTB 2501]|uniref:DUF2218 domain-containing protein n=1 Tax=Streptomyces sp. IMTB 2501 TaxID=1776340 RepID=UPI00096CED1A|nr:DUF2218 domain-containing protein [Streptomyces sp. IMTB 2501]OLZ74353.1 hypothetical protein AV521_01350 [Streptomyces sp. IMTB 2501]
MPTAEALVPTDRASRYLVQLCRHLSQMRGMRHRPPVAHGGGQMPPEVRHVDYSDTHGTIRFAQGLCTLQATSDTLTLRVEADDEDAMERLRNGIAGRVEKIGRRDRLTVTWRPLEASDAPSGETAYITDVPAAGVAKGRGIGKVMGLAAVGVVVVALHLGLGGAVLAASSWTGWGVNAIVAIVLLKLLFMGGHVVLGRAGRQALRRSGKRLRPASTGDDPGKASGSAGPYPAAGEC